MLRWLVWRDLILAWRRRADALSTLFFFVIVVSLFPLGIGPETELLRSIAPGVVCAPSVRWPKLAADGNSVNMLTSQRLTDKGGGPTFYSCLVQVEKIGD